MKKPQVRRIIPHFVQYEHSKSLSDMISDLHVQVIENRLNRLDLTTEQKLKVIDLIVAKLKSGEVHSVNQ